MCTLRSFKDFPIAVQPAMINFTTLGSFTWGNLRSPESCPETHFLCGDVITLCLPVYVRCNDFADCPQSEDEEGCEDFTCPGNQTDMAFRVKFDETMKIIII